MKNVLEGYARRVNSNRLQGLMRELGEAMADEDDPEQLRRLGSSLREIGSIAMNKYREIKDKEQ